MDHWRKMVVTAAAVSMLLLLGTLSASAQPIGLLSPQPQADREEGVLSTGMGRYVFGQISGSSKDQFMLDTRTGRIWQIAESGEVGLFLRAVPYKTADGEYVPVPEGQTEKDLKMTGLSKR